MSDNHQEPASQMIHVRFGDEILQHGFTTVPNLVLDHYSQLGISPSEMMFIIHVWQYWWTEKNPYPSLKSISSKMSISHRQMKNYVRSLKDKGYLIVNERIVPGVGRLTSQYDFSPLIQAVVSLQTKERNHAPDPLGKSSSPGVGKSSSPALGKSTSHEEYKDQEDPVQEDERYISNGKATLRDRLTQSEPDPEPQRKSRGVTHISQTLPDTFQRLARARENPEPLPPGVPPNLAHYVKAWSRELHDSEHAKSNITQAFRLMQQSGLSEDVFMQKMYEARAITKERGNIKKPATEFGEFGTKNKVPYWFAVLRDLLGMKEKPDQTKEYQYGP